MQVECGLKPLAITSDFYVFIFGMMNTNNVLHSMCRYVSHIPHALRTRVHFYRQHSERQWKISQAIIFLFKFREVISLTKVEYPPKFY